MGSWDPQYSVRLCCVFEGKGLTIISNAEQAFQPFIEDAAELEGMLWLSREISLQVCFIEDPLLAELGIVSLAFSPVVQMALPAWFPMHTTHRSSLCFTSLPSNRIRSFALSLGCLWYSQSFFFSYIICETPWEGKNHIPLGWLWLLLLFLSVREMKGLLGGKNNYMGVGCWVLCSCLSDRFLSLPRLACTLVEKRKSKACENLSVMSVRVSHLCFNSSASPCCSLWGRHTGLRWGGLFRSFPSTANRFLLHIKVPLKSVKDLHLEKRW